MSVKATRFLLLSLLLAACSSAPDATPAEGTPDPELEKRFSEMKARMEQQNEFGNVLITLDQSIDSYVTALDMQGAANADKRADSLKGMIRQTVTRHLPKLKTAAADSSSLENQAIALAALGFADKDQDVMPLLLAGAQMSNPVLVDRAVLGLAMYLDSSTPPGVLIAIAENADHSIQGRAQAAWALFRLQDVSTRQAEIIEYWRKVTMRPADVNSAGILLNAIRGLGKTLDKAHVSCVLPHAGFPVPAVRLSVAVAIGRMNAQGYEEVLLQMLSPAETNPNVRLAARLALKALAGGIDRGYDVAAWRKAFERS